LKKEDNKWDNGGQLTEIERRSREQERKGRKKRIRTDGDVIWTAQSSAQHPVPPNRHRLARRILREIDFDVPLQPRGMWTILSKPKKKKEKFHPAPPRHRRRRRHYYPHCLKRFE
jgi:hypothetical protein